MAYLTDGYQTLIAFGSVAGAGAPLTFLEKEVHPPSIKGGGGIDITNMRQGVIVPGVLPGSFPRTQLPKHLYSVGDTTTIVEWDSTMYNFNQVMAFINQLTDITITFPDGNVETFYGWLDEFTPASMKEGELPTAELKICYAGLSSRTWTTAFAYTPLVTPPLLGGPAGGQGLVP
jgi:hypothetical protein